MDYKKERKENWMKENSLKSQILGNNILPMHPDIGSYIKVENLEISEEFFKDEYEQIRKSYFSVIEKLDEFYKKKKL